MVPASDVANLSILGYDPAKYYTGRGPLEAANLGITLKENEVAFRCNTVTVGEDKMIDYSAGHISTKETKIIIEYLNRKLSSKSIKFYPGVSYRHLMVLKLHSKKEANEFYKIKCTPPHDILGKRISKNLPKGPGSEMLIDLMNRSRTLLLNHDINRVRVDLNENPANMIWLWGQGINISMPTFEEKFGVKGAVISAVDLVKGMAIIMGLEPINVPGATGYYDTNYQAKAEYAIDALNEKDFVYVHIEAPDEAGHNGDVRAKITAIENIDRFIVGPILLAVKEKKDYRIVVLPDHATPISVRSHTREPVPFAIAGKGIESDGARIYTEKAAEASKLVFKNGAQVMEYLIGGK